MQELSGLIGRVMPQQGQLTKNHQSKSQRTLELLRNPSDSCVNSGVNALDVIPSNPVEEKTLAEAKEMLEQNFGTAIPDAKWMMLCQRIIEEDWSEQRFKRTLKWFLENKRFPSWTIADWFDYNVRLYPIQWMNAEIHKMGNPPKAWERFDRYRLDGVVLCKHKDGVELPLEKIA